MSQQNSIQDNIANDRNLDYPVRVYLDEATIGALRAYCDRTSQSKSGALRVFALEGLRHRIEGRGL